MQQQQNIEHFILCGIFYIIRLLGLFVKVYITVFLQKRTFYKLFVKNNQKKQSLL